MKCPQLLYFGLFFEPGLEGRMTYWFVHRQKDQKVEYFQIADDGSTLDNPRETG